MSYVSDTTTREEFLAERNTRSRQVAQVALHQFDIFCNALYDKDGDVLIQDIKSTGIFEKSYTLLNQFSMWLSEDHLDISVPMGKSSRPMTKRMPRTIYSYLVVLKSYFEEFGGIEINDRRFKKRVKVPKKITIELEPFTHEEIRLICDIASSDRKTLYMTLKDSGMRVGEAIQLVKSDIDTGKNPIEIKIRAETTKTKQARTTFVTSETSHMLVNRLHQINDTDFVFATNSDPIKAVRNETLMFKYYREKAGLTEKYSHNGRHKKNIHSFRAFACTQVAEVHGEEFAHGYIGHTKYLPMYIRRKEKLPQMFKQCENKLMIYERIEVVDQDERVRQLEEKQEKSRIDMIALANIMTQLADIRADNARKDLEIKQLQNMLENR
ncbi:putative tyrosine recombinase XerC protein [Marine Group I thaumarchaeote SCGC RSA3]|uniref:Putative tyrosine recombinase XerC protein n=2 Tax=Marine Group I TaxID=905826 RepID=A0A087RT44_9ARCH|nr:putative tyrosine recombinase XerC protein [Marine Group I thaumarchaeote SCGC AAA799-D11]KFM18701.1 putative tyrosine recombinase XerC protein [Marine Group I thaumarchaeote SCGC RSA3]